MTIGALDRAVLPMDLELRVLVAADLATDPFGLGLCRGQVARALAAITLHLPPAILMWHHPVRVSCHLTAPIEIGPVSNAEAGRLVPVKPGW